GAVLGDVKRDATIALRHPLQRIGESVGVYFPAGLRVRVPRLVDASRAHWPRRRVASRHATSVVVHADEIDRLLAVLELRGLMIGPRVAEHVAQLVRVAAVQEGIEVLP